MTSLVPLASRATLITPAIKAKITEILCAVDVSLIIPLYALSSLIIV